MATIKKPVPQQVQAATSPNGQAAPAPQQAPAAPVSSVQGKFALARSEMNEFLIERHDEIDICLVSVLSQKNPLFVGEPGTGKSFMARALLAWIDGASKFEWCISKFTQPEELFGLYSLQGMKNDEYIRKTRAKLPEASIAFLDEIFKGSSAINNTLLPIMNERIFDDGTGPKQIPLKCLISASNEFPGDDGTGNELGAMFDRFLLRKIVKPVSTAAGLEKLDWGDLTPKFSQKVTLAEIDQAHAEVLQIPWSHDAREARQQLLAELKEGGMAPGDRRRKQTIEVCQAFAYLTGDTEVKVHHLAIMESMWKLPEHAQKWEQVVAKYATNINGRINALLLAVEESVRTVDVTNPSQQLNVINQITQAGTEIKTFLGRGHDHRVTKVLDYLRGLLNEFKVRCHEANRRREF